MKSPVVAREIRYRLLDGAEDTAWTHKRFPLGPVTIPDVVRAGVYEIEVRNIGLQGTSSAWVAIPLHTVDDPVRQGAAALPPVTTGNVASRWISGTAVTYTATETTADISVSAGVLQISDKQIAYGASAAQITGGTAEEVRTVWLYYDDPLLHGGTRTLGVTTDPVTSLASTGRILIAPLRVTFDTAGGGGTGGGGDIGGGGGGSGGNPYYDTVPV